jgi:hypothetical protein
MERLAGRDIAVDHITVLRLGAAVHPEMIDAARPSRHAADARWFTGETYVKVTGEAVRLSGGGLAGAGHRSVRHQAQACRLGAPYLHHGSGCA